MKSQKKNQKETTRREKKKRVQKCPHKRPFIWKAREKSQKERKGLLTDRRSNGKKRKSEAEREKKNAGKP